MNHEAEESNLGSHARAMSALGLLGSELEIFEGNCCRLLEERPRDTEIEQKPLKGFTRAIVLKDSESRLRRKVIP